MVNNFWQSVDVILEDVSVTEIIAWCYNMNSNTIIVQCSKNYGTPTRIARLKIEPNMADRRSDMSQRKVTVALWVAEWVTLLRLLLGV